jgi:predicted TIM-barrel fold metal-dependent hydrolase
LIEALNRELEIAKKQSSGDRSNELIDGKRTLKRGKTYQYEFEELTGYPPEEGVQISMTVNEKTYSGKYLGDPVFFPVLEELNRRHAIVYVHPLSPQCCGAILPDLPVATIEYAVDSTRTMASLVFGGAAAKYPNIRWIFSHSGGTTPFLLSRFIRQEQDMKGEAVKRMPNGVMYEYKKFYYETAQGNHAGALDALLRIIPLSQVLYGTDFPYRDGAEVNAGLAAYRFSAAELMTIDRDNALRLMPRLKNNS